jgi:2-dehydro-3-deoxy-D-gluconate 5-dehydrogenase
VTETAARPGLAAFSLEGRTALVTGARSGIGRGLALGLADAGARVALWGHRDDLDETAAELEAAGRLAGTVAADLGDPAAVERAAAGLLAEQRVDVLVNNAGIIRRGPAADSPREHWDEVLAVNLDAVFQLSQLFGRPMLERGGGKVINIASVLSFQGGINVVSYTTSKHAVAGLTRALATEWAGRGVQVNAIAPGYIRTDNTRALVEDPVRYRAITDRIPTGRWGTPADLVGAAVFLASGASDYVSGHVLAVDGGWLAR